MLFRLMAVLAMLTASAYGQFTCTRNYAQPAVSGTVKIITAGAQQIRVCAIYFQVKQNGTAVDFGLVAGQGTNCATNQQPLTPMWSGVPDSLQQYTQEVPPNAILAAPVGYDVCMKLTGAPAVANTQVVFDLL